MKWFPIKTFIFLLVVGAAGTAGYIYLPDYWKKLYAVKYRHDSVSEGSIVVVVNATGTVKPTKSFSVGAFVSGPIVSETVEVDPKTKKEKKTKHPLAEFNQIVKAGDSLAKIDPRIYEAAVARDRAQLSTRKADRNRVEALWLQADRNHRRAQELRKENRDYISDTEMDQFFYNLESLKAQLKLAEFAIDQAEANLENSETNLKYTEIRSPVDGIVIDRKIEEGQTLAAQFQTPELFVIAPDLKTMHVHATVDEADIGLVVEAKRMKLPVTFTVDAHPNDLFTGFVYQIRKSPTTTQNVVTYPVIVETKNPDLKLFPGMTASLSFQVDEVKKAVRIPNAALRFYPDRARVRKEDHKVLDGTTKKTSTDDDDSAQSRLTAKQKAELRRNRNRRHVWVEDGDYLKAVEVVTGLSDNRYTQLVTGELKVGDKLVTGIKTK